MSFIYTNFHIFHLSRVTLEGELFSVISANEPKIETQIDVESDSCQFSYLSLFHRHVVTSREATSIIFNEKGKIISIQMALLTSGWDSPWTIQTSIASCDSPE